MSQINKEWFHDKLRENHKSLRGLARHMEIDPSAASRMFSGERRMRMDEAEKIALFLGVSVNDVLKHAGVSVDLDGLPTRIVLAATIGDSGKIERLMEARPLPQGIIDRAAAALSKSSNERVIAAQVRAAEGPLSIWDDAVILFSHTETVEPSAIGALSICRIRGGDQILAKVERARKTGEARIVSPAGKYEDTILETATPIIAVIP